MASKYLLIAALCLFASGYAQAETAEASHILVKSESDCTDLKSKLDAVEGSMVPTGTQQSSLHTHTPCRMCNRTGTLNRCFSSVPRLSPHTSHNGGFCRLLSG